MSCTLIILPHQTTILCCVFSKQRRATRKEVRELEELVESELKDARTTLNIQVSALLLYLYNTLSAYMLVSC